MLTVDQLYFQQNANVGQTDDYYIGAYLFQSTMYKGKGGWLRTATLHLKFISYMLNKYEIYKVNTRL